MSANAPRMPFRPCSMPRPYRAAPSRRASRACRRRQASSPARATASASLASSDAAALSRNVSAPPRANAAWKDSAASSTRRSARARRRGASPAPPRRPVPAQPGPGRGWPGPIGSSLRAVARTGSAAGRAAPGCPRDAAAAAGNAAAARRARTAPSHRRGRRCRCLPAPFRRQRSGERGRARARLRSASDPRLPRRSNRYPVHPPGNRPASAPALRAGRAADRPPRSTASGARRWPATGGAAVQDYPAGEWKRSADDAGPGAVPARVPARPGGGRQRRFPQSRSMPANTRGTASASSPLSRRLAAQPAMGRGVLGSGEWSRASLMRHLERGARARRWREVSRLR